MEIEESSRTVKAIDWNNLEDPLDKEIWEKLTSQFWLDTNFPLSNDLTTWNTLTDYEKEATRKVFGGLTLLDTIQGTVGAISMIPDAQTPQEEAVLTNIAFMESVHAKSYSSIFSTLCSKQEIKDVFRWTEENEYLQKKEKIMLSFYDGQDPLQKKIASTMLESFLFYSGFYMPMYWSSHAKLPNSADMIRLIIRDESVHGYAIGRWYQKAVAKLSPAEQEEYADFAYELLDELHENEVQYTQEIYDPMGLTEDVKAFLRYNANKALMNLGYEAMFTKDQTNVNPAIISSLSLGTETGDFFSGTNSYVVANVEDLDDDAFDF